jgi:BirA family transcriptional regulator, biotin operon repressor / biotin---[acetyl-CoA-carboxylase] ligase
MGDAAPGRRGGGRGDQWVIRRFAELDSTNRWVVEQARAGAPAGLVAVADHQTAGRGRRGRSWTAPAGSSLLVSVLLRPELAADETQVLTMATGVALVDAVERVAGVRAELKWPNDVVVGDRKLAGILAEADVGERGDVRAVVVGVGCNVEWDFPAQLARDATACNLEAGRAVDRGELLDALLAGLASRLDALVDVASAYRARLGTLGREVRVETERSTVEGVADDVDGRGRLIVTPPGRKPVTVSVGDVVHLRPADGERGS